MICDYAGQGSFTASRRSVKNYRSKLVCRNGAAKEAALSNNVVLTDIFIEVTWPHAGSQRLLSQFDLFEKTFVAQ